MNYFWIGLLAFVATSSTAAETAVTTANQDAAWALVYENDESGKTLTGDLDDLIAAVRNGERIRIGWTHQSPDDESVRVEHVADAKFLTVMSRKTVMAQIDPIVGQAPDFEAQEIRLRENLEWVLIASSNGKCDTMTRNAVTGEIVSHETRRWGIRWLVRR